MEIPLNNEQMPHAFEDKTRNTCTVHICANHVNTKHSSAIRLIIIYEQ